MEMVPAKRATINPQNRVEFVFALRQWRQHGFLDRLTAKGEPRARPLRFLPIAAES
jgi:hypothetical protein